MILICYKCRIFIICLIISLTKLRVLSAHVLETAVKGSTNENRTLHKYCLGNSFCDGYKQYCNTHIQRCECLQFYQYGSDTSNCSPCPDEGESCMGCCAHAGLKCSFGICECDEDYYDCDNSRDIFMNASQIALVAALIMGAAALAILLYRICTKPSYFGSRRIRFNRNAEARESDLPAESRASLTSIQVRVISRLRDRPPKYETQHNYDTRIQRQEEERPPVRSRDTDVSISTIPVSAAEHAPPAYDGSKESVNELPPPYSDTGYDSLPDVIMVNRSVSNNNEDTSESIENSTVSIISNACSTTDVLNENNSQQDNRDDKSIHM